MKTDIIKILRFELYIEYTFGKPKYSRKYDIFRVTRDWESMLFLSREKIKKWGKRSEYKKNPLNALKFHILCHITSQYS